MNSDLDSLLDAHFQKEEQSANAKKAAQQKLNDENKENTEEWQGICTNVIIPCFDKAVNYLGEKRKIKSTVIKEKIQLTINDPQVVNIIKGKNQFGGQWDGPSMTLNPSPMTRQASIIVNLSPQRGMWHVIGTVGFNELKEKIDRIVADFISSIL